jgi:hypothetical protein
MNRLRLLKKRQRFQAGNDRLARRRFPRRIELPAPGAHFFAQRIFLGSCGSFHLLLVFAKAKKKCHAGSIFFQLRRVLD